LIAAGDKPPQYGYTFELHLDSPDGKKIGEVAVNRGIKLIMQGGFGSGMVSMNLEPVTDGKLHNLYLVSKAINAAEPNTFVLLAVKFKAK
jgi:hypothetical protein